MPSAMTPGEPYPLGASWDGAGTNFAVFSQSADSVDLCLFDEAGNETVYELPEVDAVRVARVPGGSRAWTALRLQGARDI